MVITSIEIAYMNSPRSIKSLTLALSVLPGSIGNKLVASFNSYFQDTAGNLTIATSDYFWYFTLLMIVTGVLFIIYIPHYKGKVYLQKMKTSLPERSVEHYLKIKKINDIILKIAKDKISFVLLVGAIVRRGQQKDSDITISAIDDFVNNDHNFLIITKHRKHAKTAIASQLENQIKDKLISKNIDLKRIIITIESVDQFNLRSEAIRLFKEGILLYGSGRIMLSEPKHMTKIRRLEIAHKSYKHWYKKGLNFLKIYETMKNKIDDNGLLVLQLHQAAESLYNCSLLVLTGDKPHSHELERLNYLLCAESNQFINIFPSSTKEEKQCFKLLDNGYIDSRYNLNYLITDEQLKYLFEKIEELKEITKEVCEEEIKTLELER